MLHIDVYYANIATLSCRRSKRNAAAAGLEGAAAAAGRAGLRVGPGGTGPSGAPGSPNPENPHELASNEDCTRIGSGRACWNGTGTAFNPASWNGSGRNIHKYARNMQLYVKICLKYANI